MESPRKIVPSSRTKKAGFLNKTVLYGHTEPHDPTGTPEKKPLREPTYLLVLLTGGILLDAGPFVYP
jgi:hypothetical protein